MPITLKYALLWTLSTVILQASIIKPRLLNPVLLKIAFIVVSDFDEMNFLLFVCSVQEQLKLLLIRFREQRKNFAKLTIASYMPGSLYRKNYVKPEFRRAPVVLKNYEDATFLRSLINFLTSKLINDEQIYINYEFVPFTRIYLEQWVSKRFL